MSWFGDFVGGAAGAGASIMRDQRLADDRMAEREMDRKASLEQSKTLAQFQADLQEKKMMTAQRLAQAAADAKEAKVQQQFDQSGIIGKQIGVSRDVAGLKLPEGQYGPSMGPDEVSTMSPKQRSQYEGAGLIQKQTGSGLIADRIEAARSMGALPEVRKELDGQYNKQVDAEFKREQSDRQERALDQKDAAQADRERRTEALFAKIATGNGRGEKGDTDQWLKLIGEQRKGYKDDLAQLNNARREEVAAEPNPKKKQEIIARFDAQITSLRSKSDEIDAKIEAVTSRLLDKPNAPKMGDKSTPAQSGPPVGTVYNGYRFKGGANIQSNWEKVK